MTPYPLIGCVKDALTAYQQSAVERGGLLANKEHDLAVDAREALDALVAELDRAEAALLVAQQERGELQRHDEAATQDARLFRGRMVVALERAERAEETITRLLGATREVLDRHGLHEPLLSVYRSVAQDAEQAPFSKGELHPAGAEGSHPGRLAGSGSPSESVVGTEGGTARQGTARRSRRAGSAESGMSHQSEVGADSPLAQDAEQAE